MTRFEFMFFGTGSCNIGASHVRAHRRRSLEAELSGRAHGRAARPHHGAGRRGCRAWRNPVVKSTPEAKQNAVRGKFA